jgi:hypothetical protein
MQVKRDFRLQDLKGLSFIQANLNALILLAQT